MKMPKKYSGRWSKAACYAVTLVTMFLIYALGASVFLMLAVAVVNTLIAELLIDTSDE